MDKTLRLRMILDAAGGATKFLRGVKGEAGEAGKALKATRERLGDLKRASREIDSFKRLETELGSTRQKLEAAQKEAQRLGRAHASAASPTKQLTRALELAGHKVNELKQREQQHVGALQAVRNKLNEAGISTKRLAGHEMRLKRETEEATGALKRQQKQLETLANRQRRMDGARTTRDRTQAFAGNAQSAGLSALAGGAAVAAPVALAAREAMKFEDAMADVRKVVDFPTPAAFSQMSSDILALSGRLPVASEELANIMALGARAGVARKDLLAYTEAAAKMGVAFDISSEEAGGMMATWRTAFGLEQSGVMQLANQVNALTNAHGGNAAAVAEMITRVGPLADVAGASSAHLAALAQVMNSVGVESEVGATGIKNMLLGMTKGESATKAQAKAFKALGLDASVMARRMQTDAGGAIMSVLEQVSKLDKDRQLSVLGQLFGTESVAAISPMLSQLELVRRNFREVGDAQFYAGSMDKEYAARAATTSNALKLAQNNAAALGVEIGSALLPAINDAAKMFGQAATTIRDFSKEHPLLTKLIAYVVIGLSAVMIVFGGLALAIGTVLAPFAMLSFAMTTLGISTTIALWPVLLVIAAIAALAIGALLIWKYWAPISAFFGALWEGIKAKTLSVINTLVFAFMNFTPAGHLIKAFTAVWPALQALWPKFKEAGGNLIKGLIDGLKGGLPGVIRAIVGGAGQLITAFKNRLGIHSPSRVFAALGDYTMAGLTGGLTRSSGSAIAAVSRVGAGMTSALAMSAASPPEIAFDTGPRIGPGGSSAAGSAGGAAPSIGSVTINIYPREGQDARSIANEVAAIIRSPGLSSFEDDHEGLD